MHCFQCCVIQISYILSYPHHIFARQLLYSFYNEDTEAHRIQAIFPGHTASKSLSWNQYSGLCDLTSNLHLSMLLRQIILWLFFSFLSFLFCEKKFISLLLLIYIQERNWYPIPKWRKLIYQQLVFCHLMGSFLGHFMIMETYNIINSDTLITANVPPNILSKM